jgi:hypothetical protein
MTLDCCHHRRGADNAMAIAIGRYSARVEWFGRRSTGRIFTDTALGRTNFNDPVDSGSLFAVAHQPNGRLTLCFTSIRVPSFS